MIPHITVNIDEVEEDAPHTYSNGKAVTATIMQQEEPHLGAGMGALPFIDCAIAGDDDAGLPDPSKFKEAALMFFNTVSMGVPTPPGRFSSQLDRFIDGSLEPMKKAAKVFPNYSAPMRPAG